MANENMASSTYRRTKHRGKLLEEMRFDEETHKGLAHQTSSKSTYFSRT
jgi:hypothetical protein